MRESSEERGEAEKKLAKLQISGLFSYFYIRDGNKTDQRLHPLLSFSRHSDNLPMTCCHIYYYALASTTQTSIPHKPHPSTNQQPAIH
jgi:hypothetical protein